MPPTILAYLPKREKYNSQATSGGSYQIKRLPDWSLSG